MAGGRFDAPARARRTRRVLFLAGLFVACVACGGPSPDGGTEVRIQVRVDEVLGAEQLRVRVFDTNRALASDRRQALDGRPDPVVVPLFPDGEGERSYHVVLDLFGAGEVPLGTQRVIGAYVDGESRIIRVRFTAACTDLICNGQQTCRGDGGARCVDACFEPQLADDETLPLSGTCSRRVYVDGATGVDDPEACLGPEAPCASVRYVLEQYLADEMGGTVDVAGGSTYARFDISAEHSGSLETPTTIRGWPATGRPIFDGGGEGSGIGTCCGDAAARNFVLEGLDVTGGLQQGIFIHGSAARNVVIRDCVVGGTIVPGGVAFPSQVGAIVVTNEASGVELVGNLVRDNLGTNEDDEGELVRTIGISVVGESARLVGNRVEGTSGEGMLIVGDDHHLIANQVISSGVAGIRIDSADIAVLMDNVVCGAMGPGISIDGSQRGSIEHNTIVRCGGDGIRLQSGSEQWRIERSIFAFNRGSGLARVEAEGSEPLDSENLFWMNMGGAFSAITPDGVDWVDTIEPLFTNAAECDVALVVGSEAAGLIAGGPVGARAAD